VTGGFLGAAAADGTAIWTLDTTRSLITARYANGDLNASGTITVTDIPLLLEGWGMPGPADFNCDGEVDATDLTLLLAAVRQTGTLR
jgi:hypothetical protein